MANGPGHRTHEDEYGENQGTHTGGGRERAAFLFFCRHAADYATIVASLSVMLGILTKLCGAQAFGGLDGTAPPPPRIATQPAMPRTPVNPGPGSPSSVANADFKNTSLPFEKRAADLVKPHDPPGKRPAGPVATPPNARLGITGVNWWTEGIHGISRNGRATVFPQAIGMAASWDPDLLIKVGDATADEARAKYDSYNTGGPASSATAASSSGPPPSTWPATRAGAASRKPTAKTPTSPARLAVAFCQGMQGDDPKYLKTVATPKHFAMHSQETGRTTAASTSPSARPPRLLPPRLRRRFIEGKATSIMTAFNGINGIPCTANPWLLTDLLRDEWGFEGAVVSDFGAARMLFTAHHYVNSEDRSRRRRPSMPAGCHSATRRLTHLDVVVRRRSMARSRKPSSTAPCCATSCSASAWACSIPPKWSPSPKCPRTAVGSKEHIAARPPDRPRILRPAQKRSRPQGYGFDKLLPLDLRRINSIAVIGPYANIAAVRQLQRQPGRSRPPRRQRHQGRRRRSRLIRTADYVDNDDAIKAAAASDVAIFVVGLNQHHRIRRHRPLHARSAHRPAQLLETVVNANPLTIVVLEGGGPIGCTWFKEHVPAAPHDLVSRRAGRQRPGRNPPGPDQSLRQTPRHLLSRPSPIFRALDDYDITNGRTYMYLQKKPCFPFGYGLSYTSSPIPTSACAPRIASTGTITRQRRHHQRRPARWR